MAAPEVTFSLTDFQRTVLEDTLDPQIAETVTQAEAETMMAETLLSPRSHLFDSSLEKYRERDTTAEKLDTVSVTEE